MACEYVVERRGSVALVSVNLQLTVAIRLTMREQFYFMIMMHTEHHIVFPSRVRTLLLLHNDLSLNKNSYERRCPKCETSANRTHNMYIECKNEQKQIIVSTKRQLIDHVRTNYIINQFHCRTKNKSYSDLSLLCLLLNISNKNWPNLYAQNECAVC